MCHYPYSIVFNIKYESLEDLAMSQCLQGWAAREVSWMINNMP